MKPEESGYYFYFDGEQRYLVDVSQSRGAKSEWDGPLMASSMRLDIGGYFISTVSEMNGEWSKQLELLEKGVFKDLAFRRCCRWNPDYIRNCAQLYLSFLYLFFTFRKMRKKCLDFGKKSNCETAT